MLHDAVSMLQNYNVHCLAPSFPPSRKKVDHAGSVEKRGEPSQSPERCQILSLNPNFSYWLPVESPWQGSVDPTESPYD